jgi:diadenosine tetraphosphatase ApaH/serine/threonine PP2A family protein phosphatase
MTEPLALRIDPLTRFPLVEVPGQGFALFWLPLTKIQAEYFLSDTIVSRFDRAWYRERLRTNPRVTPQGLKAWNLAQAFLTDITFAEARMISRWYGPDYDLPTSQQWQQALRSFAALPADPAFVQRVLAEPGLHLRAASLIQACEQALPAYQRVAGRRLSHQLMLSPGILEYVYQDAARTRCEACGSSFQVMRAGSGTTLALRDPQQGERMATLGVRPLLRL